MAVLWRRSFAEAFRPQVPGRVKGKEEYSDDYPFKDALTVRECPSQCSHRKSRTVVVGIASPLMQLGRIPVARSVQRRFLFRLDAAPFFVLARVIPAGSNLDPDQ